MSINATRPRWFAFSGNPVASEPPDTFDRNREGLHNEQRPRGMSIACEDI